MTAYCPLWWATSKATSTCKMNSRFFGDDCALLAFLIRAGSLRSTSPATLGQQEGLSSTRSGVGPSSHDSRV